MKQASTVYLTYCPIGTSGHRASALVGFIPYQNYSTPPYGNPAGCYLQLPMPAAPPHYVQPPIYTAPYAPATQHRAPTATTSGGGISAVLEYDPTEMAAFMCWYLFGMLDQNRTPTKEFEASIVSILNATRLPTSTIVIALEYIDQRYSATSHTSMLEPMIFLKIVVALVLASKFNDDNTFTNKSWSGASGVHLDMLNAMESEWLDAVIWNLNVVNFRENIKTLQECWASWLQKPAVRPWATQGANPTAFYSQPSSFVASDSYDSFLSVPSSPIYDSTSASSVYGGYSSPVYASPAKFPQDWNVLVALSFLHTPHPAQFAPYVQLQSIWAYAPTAYQSMPPRMDSAPNGFANPNYNCLTTY